VVCDDEVIIILKDLVPIFSVDSTRVASRQFIVVDSRHSGVGEEGCNGPFGRGHVAELLPKVR
jgi:hypothetical protein